MEVKTCYHALNILYIVGCNEFLDKLSGHEIQRNDEILLRYITNDDKIINI
jgi:hypothetical protein